ncbi:putative flippase GtrA [Sphingomonas jinjuensis]|uniref:Putative flippase GtrA n=1 Tax=Sphingomonas jinjuensis TaxID=535907 RepID=A0A840F6Z5_9SPHN|nr:putative flippase GtrA [Sphingomonas jinjuensis]
MTALLHRLDRMRESGLLGQIVRFGIAGIASSLIYSAVYLPLTFWVFPREHAVYAVPFAFAVAVTCGFYMHSRWSFRDHGTRRRGGGQQAKFVAVQASGMLLNAVVTWIGTALLGYPAWVPLIPAILLATIVTFLLNRYLVFA